MRAAEGTINRTADRLSDNRSIVQSVDLHPVDTAVLTMHILHHFPEGTSIFLIQSFFTGGDVDARIPFSLRQRIGIFQQFAHTPLAPVLRKSINEAYPGCQRWFPDIILFRVSTESDQVIGIRKQKDPGIFTTKPLQGNLTLFLVRESRYPLKLMQQNQGPSHIPIAQIGRASCRERV